MLIRRIRNSSQWADMWSDPIWRTPEDCPPSALWQLYEARRPDGALSVWRVTKDEDYENVAAADVLQKGVDAKSELQDLSYVEIAEEYLKVGDYTMVDKPGNTPLQDVNMKHVDIQSVTGKMFIQFARLVKKHGQLRTITSARIAARIAQRLENGDLVPSSFKVSREQVGGLLYALWKSNAVVVRRPS